MYILGVTGLVEGAQEYALLFGLWTAFIEVIPYIGPWLSAVPPAIFALFADPPWGVVWVGLLFLFIYQVEGHIVVPNVMASALRLHPLLVIFGLLAGGALYGIAGVLVALPTMAGGRAIWEFFRERVKLESWEEGGGEVPVEVEHRAAESGERLAPCSTRSSRRPRPRARSGARLRFRRRSGCASRCSRGSRRTTTRSVSRRSTRATSSTTAAPACSRRDDRDTALLLGDYLYAHGLVHVAETGDVKAVSDLAELISRCAQLRAEGLAATGTSGRQRRASLGGRRWLGRDATTSVAAALAAHARLVGIESPRCWLRSSSCSPRRRSRRRTRRPPKRVATSSSRCSSSA